MLNSCILYPHHFVPVHTQILLLFHTGRIDLYYKANVKIPAFLPYDDFEKKVADDQCKIIDTAGA